MFALRENIGLLEFLNFAILVEGLFINDLNRCFHSCYFMLRHLNGTDLIIMDSLTYHFILIDLTWEAESRKQFTQLFASLSLRFEKDIAWSSIFGSKFHRVEKSTGVRTPFGKSELDVGTCELVNPLRLVFVGGDELDLVRTQLDLVLFEPFSFGLQITRWFRFCVMFDEHLAN